MSRKHEQGRLQRIRDAIWQAHDLLHKDDPDGAHVMIHRALGIPDDRPVNDAAPAAVRFVRFDEGFRALCIEHGIDAAFFAVDGLRILSGGGADLCRYLDEMIRTGTDAKVAERKAAARRVLGEMGVEL